MVGDTEGKSVLLAIKTAEDAIQEAILKKHGRDF